MLPLTRRLALLSLITLALFCLLAFPALAGGPGDLDVSFNGTGIVTHAAFCSVTSVALQPDGKIVVAGAVCQSSTDFGLARYNENGTLDTTFGASGLVTTSINGVDSGEAIAIQPDGKLVVAGYSVVGGADANFAVVRYHSDGSLDAAFGSSGIVTTPIASWNYPWVGNSQDYGRSVVIQSDGKIVVGGSSSVQDGSYHATLVRYNSDGSLDTTWNSTGIITNELQSGIPRHVVTRQLDDRLVVAGTSPGGRGFLVLRYNSDGSLDNTFGASGIVTTSVAITDYLGYFVTVRPNSKILITGAYRQTSPICAVIRYNNDGSLDTTFNSTGVVTLSMGQLCIGSALAVESDERTILFGFSRSFSPFDFTVARFTNNGHLDGSFHQTGIVTTALGSKNDFGLTGLVQPDGKIVAASSSTEYGLALVRYLGDFTATTYLPSARKEP